MTEQERKAPLEMKDITVDVGAVSKEEAVEKFGVRIGEPVVPDVTFTYSETTDLMVGKSFDCRLGCAAILKTMHTLAGQELNVDIVGACAAQEEVGVRGATVTAQVIKPDIAIHSDAARDTKKAAIPRPHWLREHTSYITPPIILNSFLP